MKRLFLAAMATVLAWTPAQAFAAEVFACSDAAGKVTYVTVDIPGRHVTLKTGTAPARCISDFRDGVESPLFTAPAGEYCVFALMAGDNPERKYVRVEGVVVSFGAITSTGRVDETLDMRTGILETPADTEQCRRARS